MALGEEADLSEGMFCGWLERQKWQPPDYTGVPIRGACARTFPHSAIMNQTIVVDLYRDGLLHFSETL